MGTGAVADRLIDLYGYADVVPLESLRGVQLLDLETLLCFACTSLHAA